ncbi:MAG: hypothetical protein ACYCS4_14015 [Acidimicrobiales bacterium]
MSEAGRSQGSLCEPTPLRGVAAQGHDPCHVGDDGPQIAPGAVSLFSFLFRQTQQGAGAFRGGEQRRLGLVELGKHGGYQLPLGCRDALGEIVTSPPGMLFELIEQPAFREPRGPSPCDPRRHQRAQQPADNGVRSFDVEEQIREPVRAENVIYPL